MADYIIVAVHYEERNRSRYIALLRVRADFGTSVGSPDIQTRLEVVKAINPPPPRSIYRTAYQDKSGWHRGARVEVFNVNGVDYLRTDGNRIAEDNLGELPEF